MQLKHIHGERNFSEAEEGRYCRFLFSPKFLDINQVGTSKNENERSTSLLLQLPEVSYQRSHVCFETFHSRLLSRWAAAIEKQRKCHLIGGRCYLGIKPISKIASKPNEVEKRKGTLMRPASWPVDPTSGGAPTCCHYASGTDARERQQVTSPPRGNC